MKRNMDLVFSLFGAIIATCFSMEVSAVEGNADYNTFMYKSYASGSGLESFSVQWENYDGWKSEMGDYCDPYVSQKNTTALHYYLVAGIPAGLPLYLMGHNADIITVQTHGRHTGSNGSSDFTGWLNNYSGSDDLSSRLIYPNDDEPEIYIIHSCDYLSNANYSQWYGFRNLHHHGALVIAGCWGTCWIAEEGVWTTFEEMGDALDDDDQTIKSAWWEALGVGTHDSGNAIFGMGKKSSSNCDDRARNVTMRNRNDYTEYSYGLDESYSGSLYEVCGYYVETYDPA